MGILIAPHSVRGHSWHGVEFPNRSIPVLASSAIQALRAIPLRGAPLLIMVIDFCLDRQRLAPAGIGLWRLMTEGRKLILLGPLGLMHSQVFYYHH